MDEWQKKMTKTLEEKYNEPKSPKHMEMERELNSQLAEEQVKVSNLEDQVLALSGYLESVRDID
jgi:hypothetical protein